MPEAKPAPAASNVRRLICMFKFPLLGIKTFQSALILKQNRRQSKRLTPIFSIGYHSGNRSGLVTEVTFTGKDHGDAAFIGRRDHFGVTDGAARLNHASGAGVNHHIQAVTEREERITCYGRAF